MPLPKPPVRPALFLTPSAIEETNKTGRRMKPHASMSDVNRSNAANHAGQNAAAQRRHANQPAATANVDAAHTAARAFGASGNNADAASAASSTSRAASSLAARPAAAASSTAASVITMFEPRPKKKALGDAVKLFVLDTNVLMHDPSALFRFEEHDV